MSEPLAPDERREFRAEARRVDRVLLIRGVEPDHTVVLRINGHRRRLSPAEAERLGRELLAAAEAGRAIAEASWSL